MSNYINILNNQISEDQIYMSIKAIKEKGIVILRNANSVEICQNVTGDYLKYVGDNLNYVNENLDTNGREKRLVNFHLHSKNSALIASNSIVMSILDTFFGEEAAVYSSLTFKYGTQQPVHRDTPHFYTAPPCKFVGVWSALENINPNSGPIFYHPGGHLFEIDPKKHLIEAVRRDPLMSLDKQLLTALDLYNGEVISLSKETSKPEIPELNIGDVVIWHPELPHGGSIAVNPELTRWSMVCHCAPVSIQVQQHDQFFMHEHGSPVPVRYGYKKYNNRLFALSGETAYM